MRLASEVAGYQEPGAARGRKSAVSHEAALRAAGRSWSSTFLARRVLRVLLRAVSVTPLLSVSTPENLDETQICCLPISPPALRRHAVSRPGGRPLDGSGPLDDARPGALPRGADAEGDVPGRRAARSTSIAPLGPDLFEHLNRVAGVQPPRRAPDRVGARGPHRPGLLRADAARSTRATSSSSRAATAARSTASPASVKAGLHVLADKPWILKSADLPKLEAALAEADTPEASSPTTS